MDVKIASTPGQIAEYRRLLRDDRSIGTLRRALALVEQVIGLRFVLPADDEEPRTASEYPISENLREEYRERLEELNLQVRREAEARRSRPRLDAGDRDLLELTWKTIVYLTLPVPVAPGPRSGAPTFHLTGNVSFFDDIRSIVFETAADELLPALKGQKWVGLRRTLVDALRFHVTFFWGHEPAHQHYLRSVFYEAIGDDELAGRELLNASRATAANSPDYFVKRYTYWSFLVDHQRLDEAKAFALQVLRECPPEHVSDAQELVDTSYGLLHRPQPPDGTGRARRA